MFTSEHLLHIARLVGELRTRPDVQLFFKDRNRRMPSEVGDFLRELMPKMLSDSEILTLASGCKSATVLLAARSILCAEAVRIVTHHDPLADRRRSVRVLEVPQTHDAVLA